MSLYRLYFWFIFSQVVLYSDFVVILFYSCLWGPFLIDLILLYSCLWGPFLIDLILLYSCLWGPSVKMAAARVSWWMKRCPSQKSVACWRTKTTPDSTPNSLSLSTCPSYSWVSAIKTTANSLLSSTCPSYSWVSTLKSAAGSHLSIERINHSAVY